MNKVLVKVFFPKIDKEYDVWLPLNKKIYNIIILLSNGVNSLNDDIYQQKDFPILYNRETGYLYDVNKEVMDTDIENGTELVFI